METSSGPRKEEFSPILALPRLQNKPSSVLAFLSPAGVEDRARGFQSSRLSHDCRGIKKYSPATMWEHLYPSERGTEQETKQVKLLCTKAEQNPGLRPPAPSVGGEKWGDPERRERGTSKGQSQE